MPLNDRIALVVGLVTATAAMGYFYCGETREQVEPYSRNVFLAPTDINAPENFPCFRVVDTGNSVCYRFDG